MDNALDLLYDHYKDSFENIKQNEKQRNSFFIFIAILTSLLFFIWLNPSETQTVINNIINSQIEQGLTLNFSTIQSLIWLILLYLTIRYFQITILINKQYTYLHKLEETISNQLTFDFSREGKHYNSNYSLISSAAYYFYTLIFPILYGTILTLNITTNISLFNSIIYLSIVFFLISYIITEHITSNTKLNKWYKNLHKR
jgi:hypothetical protein